jgi:hypothetical protein
VGTQYRGSSVETAQLKVQGDDGRKEEIRYFCVTKWAKGVSWEHKYNCGVMDMEGRGACTGYRGYPGSPH